jgi:microcystin-dependent protein
MMQIRSRIRAAAVAGMCLLYLAGGSFANAGTLLPNGEQYFTDNNGLPLSAGCVYFYIPGTLSPKATYQNSSQTVANTNPVQLDAAGRAIIYGTGTYRQIVKASGGGANPVLSGRHPDLGPTHRQHGLVHDDLCGRFCRHAELDHRHAPAFSGTDGQVINYISTNTNTGSATINPSGFGAVQIVRDSATGPGALTGGELVATNAVSLIYDATAGTFHILSPVTWPNTSGVPVGTSIDVRGFLAPTNYAFTYGQAVSRTTFSALLLGFDQRAERNHLQRQPDHHGPDGHHPVWQGNAVESVGIPAGATILSCTSTTCTLSANATTGRTGTMTFFAYGNGDGSTTFNLPDDRGMVLVARDNMGGTAANVTQIATTLTTNSTSTSATLGSAVGITLGMTIINANVPSGSTITAISGTTITMSNPASGSAIARRRGSARSSTLRRLVLHPPS